MSVYLDPIIPCHIKTRTGYVDGCTMWADEEDELLELAERAGIPRVWKQRSASGLLYFNLTASWRSRARAAGAVCLSDKDSGRMHRERWPVKREVPKKLQLVRL